MGSRPSLIGTVGELLGLAFDVRVYRILTVGLFPRRPLGNGAMLLSALTQRGTCFIPFDSFYRTLVPAQA